MRRVLRRVVDLLEHPGHGHHHGRPGQGELFGEVIDVGGGRRGDAVFRAHEQDELGQGVGQGQEQQAALLALQRGAQRVEGLEHVHAQVAVGQDAALGASGGAGGVDDGCDPFGRECGHSPVDLVGVGGDAAACQLVEGAVVDDQHLPVPGNLRGDLVAELAHRVRLDDGESGAAVGDHPAHLLGRRGLVDGDVTAPAARIAWSSLRTATSSSRSSAGPTSNRHAPLPPTATIAASSR
jgi:hypothetical protein